VRAQAQQVFIFILAGVIMAAVLLLGIRFIGTTLGQAEEAKEINFINEMKNMVSSLEADYGSVEKKTFRVPGDTDEVCFVEPGFGASEYSGLSPLIIEEVLVGENNFYIVKGGVPTGDNVGRIRLKEKRGIAYQCFKPVNERIVVEFEGVKGGVAVFEG
jgi:hypothetical protein